MSDRERKSSPEMKETGGVPNDLDRRTALATPADRVTGEIVAKRYRLDHELGRGGMGVVWAATHVVTRRRVAIKFLRGPAELRTDLRRRFLREARAASSVEHPNVVAVSDVFELEDETPVIVMELLTGETLRSRLAREGRLALGQAAAVLLPVVSAVASGHELGVVHRDLKPENIFLARTNAGEVVKVLDFGVAKLLALDGDLSETDSITGTGSMLGTPSYMAPEQTLDEKNVDHRADVWALGVILYECLAGVRPLRGSGIGQVVLTLATEGIQPLEKVVPDLPQEVTAMVMRMLKRERSERPDLDQVQEVLSRVADAAPMPLSPTIISPRMSVGAPARRASHQPPNVDTDAAQELPKGARPSPRRSLLVSGAAAVGILVAAFVGWRLSSQPPAPSLSTAPSPPWTTPSAAPPPDAAIVVTPASSVVLTEPRPLAQPPATSPAAAAHPREPAAARASPAAPQAASGHKTTSAAPSTAPSPEAPSAAAGITESPSAKPRPPPGGLAEKPPF